MKGSKESHLSLEGHPSADEETPRICHSIFFVTELVRIGVQDDVRVTSDLRERREKYEPNAWTSEGKKREREGEERERRRGEREKERREREKERREREKSDLGCLAIDFEVI